MYGSYGRLEDLQVLQDSNVGLEGSVLLLRAGNISFAEQVGVDLTAFLLLSETAVSFLQMNVFQVANAAAKGAAAVLIYPDPEQHKYRHNTPLYGHVSQRNCLGSL